MVSSSLPFSLFLFCLSVLRPAHASITVLGQIPLAQMTTTTSAGTAAATTTLLAAYNNTELPVPAVPNPAPSTAFTLELQSSADAVSGLSIAQSGSFFGFSIEMSVVTQVVGKNSSLIWVPFLNLMANIAQRGGYARVRVGGNTQDFAVYTEDIPDANGKCVGKQKADTNNPTETPAVLWNMDMLYMLGNISSLVNVGWYLGIPFNDTANWRLQIAQYGQEILGDRLLGLQAANEPDLYVDHGHRAQGYGPYDYFGEFGVLVNAMTSAGISASNNLIGPSVATGDWTPENVWDTGFITSYASNIGILSVEHYPDDNCFAAYGIGSPKDLNTEFATYLSHSAGQTLVQPYLNSTALAVAAGKPFMMFETNTASCGGFAGISASFGAALWALDYGLQMAYSNFTGALLHIGGQNVFYNPFTAPPTNESSFHEWTIGPVYYSALVMSEILGSTNTSRVIDLQGNDGNTYTPQYAIYENGNLAKIALFNYVSDSTGATDYTATLHLNGATAPSQVYVKYLEADSVSSLTLNSNITWAGQTLGQVYTVDGRLQGDLNVTTVNCDTTANTCQVMVPAPGFALVFLSQSYLSAETPTEPQTYSTTAVTKTANTASIDPSVLATSNGHTGMDGLMLGSTSKGSVSGATSLLREGRVAWTVVLSTLVWGALSIFLRA